MAAVAVLQRRDLGALARSHVAFLSTFVFHFSLRNVEHVRIREEFMMMRMHDSLIFYFARGDEALLNFRFAVKIDRVKCYYAQSELILSARADKKKTLIQTFNVEWRVERCSYSRADRKMSKCEIGMMDMRIDMDLDIRLNEKVFQNPINECLRGETLC